MIEVTNCIPQRVFQRNIIEKYIQKCIIMTVVFFAIDLARDKTFPLICTFTLQFCCSSSTIKTHKISLQSVITIITQRLLLPSSLRIDTRYDSCNVDSIPKHLRNNQN